jgi:hypothetical protein
MSPVEITLQDHKVLYKIEVATVVFEKPVTLYAGQNLEFT